MADTSAMRRSDSAPPALGVLFLIAGGAIVGVAFGLVPVDPASVNAPPWVLAACGLVFVLGGVLVLAQRWPRIQSAAGGTLVLVMGLVGAWVAAAGDAEHFSGGLPLVSPEANVAMARVLFGLGAALCFALFGWGLWRTVRGDAA
ncbi:MAG: hypothetical protein AAFQ43_03660 [Bacteroidota bacterium]